MGDGPNDLRVRATVQTLPDRVDNEGVSPVLLKNCTDLGSLASWFEERVVEIERFVGELPSIAVLVPDEDMVEPLAQRLGDAQSAENVPVVACPGDRVVGLESEVRVFDVQHIKGLEFEAVFFVGIDALANAKPDLFDRYLYVGSQQGRPRIWGSLAVRDCPM